MVPLKFGLDWNNSPFTVLVSVYATDGTVAITHGGVEVGQGIDTKVPGALGTGPALPAYCSISMPCKVAQVAARTLGVPLDMIVIKPSNSLTNPNGASTGGSTTSELACLVGGVRGGRGMCVYMYPEINMYAYQYIHYVCTYMYVYVWCAHILMWTGCAQCL